MIERIPMGPADILAYKFSGKLSEDDVKRLHVDLRQAIEEYGSVKLYTDVQNMESVTPRAFLEDLKLTPEYVSDVERYAVIGDERWQQWVTKLGDLVTSGQARYFEPHEASRARRWLRREYTFEEEARRAMTQRYPTGRGTRRREKRGGFLRGLVRAVWAGAAATWAMDRVTQFIMDRQDMMTVLREKMARVEGLDASHALANRAARRLGISWRLGQPHPAGVGTHYSVGMLISAVYDILRQRVEFAGRSRGLLLGLAAFLVIDEGLKPLIGAASSPGSYPLQTHLRGLAGYLVFGISADTALRALDGVEEALEKVRRDEELDFDILLEQMERIRPYGGETDLERLPRPWQPQSR